MSTFKVVLADDEPRILQALEKRIDWETLGLEIVGTASNGDEGLQLVQTEAPDLLVTDIRMPGMNGIELARAARAHLPGVEIILISGFSEFTYAQEGIELGVLGYLLKPIQQTELQELLGKAVGILKKKSVGIDPQWSEFRSFIARANASGRLAEHIQEIGLGTSGSNIFCFLTTRNPLRDLPGEDAPRIKCRVGGGVTAYLVAGNENLCSELRLMTVNYHRREKGLAGMGSIVHGVNRIEQTITEAEAAFVRGTFRRQRGAVAYQKAARVIYPYVHDLIQTLERRQTGTVRSLLTAIETRYDAEQSDAEALFPLYNALVLHARYHYSQAPATGVLPRPLQNVVELTFRARTAEELFDQMRTMVDYIRQNDNGSGDSGIAAIVQVKEYVENHFSQDLSMDLLADRVGMEKNQLSQRFKHANGKGLSEFIRETRLQHAAFLLKTTQMAVATVGELCGYSDYYYFARVFKRETGLTCTAYRQRYTPQPEDEP